MIFASPVLGMPEVTPEQAAIINAWIVPHFAKLDNLRAKMESAAYGLCDPLLIRVNGAVEAHRALWSELDRIERLGSQAKEPETWADKQRRMTQPPKE